MSDSPTPDVSLREKAERAIQTDRDAKDKPLSFVAGDKAKDALAALYLAAPPSVILALLSRVERAEADAFGAAADFIVTGFQRGERADVYALADSLRSRRKPAPTRYVCECGHTHADHVRPHDHSCLIMGCSCREYRLAPTPEATNAL